MILRNDHGIVRSKYWEKKNLVLNLIFKVDNFGIKKNWCNKFCEATKRGHSLALYPSDSEQTLKQQRNYYYCHFLSSIKSTFFICAMALSSIPYYIYIILYIYSYLYFTPNWRLYLFFYGSRRYVCTRNMVTRVNSPLHLSRHYFRMSTIVSAVSNDWWLFNFVGTNERKTTNATNPSP